MPDRVNVQPDMNKRGVSLNVPVVKWLLRDDVYGDSFGLLPSGELLAVNYQGEGECIFTVYQDFAGVVASTFGYERKVLDDLARALGV